MTYIYAALGAMVLCIGCFFAGEHFGALRGKAAVSQVETVNATQEAKQVEQQAVTDTKAEAQHDQDIEHPPTLILKQPVWLHAPSVCAVSVPAAAGSPDPSPGPANPGPTIDLRPQLAAFAAKYEASFADCRRLSAEWPK